MIFDRYAAAWRARDPDAIVALHTPDTTFRLRLDRAPAIGREQVRSAFAEMFEQWPQFGFEVYRVLLGIDHWVLDWALTAVLRNADGTGRDVKFDCVDIVTLDPSGAVRRKDTFVDFAQVQTALAPEAAHSE
jgi:uncharacterized protein (TIGR02246 family)